MKKVYFASPLFSEMERRYNAHIVSGLRGNYPSLDIYVPQEQLEINDKQAYADSKMIANFDTEALIASDLVIAILDGSTIDAGVASEIGVAYAKGIPVIGVYTDTRQLGGDNLKKVEALREIGENQFHYVNLYTIGLVKLNGIVVASEEELVSEIGERLKK
ncbi:nucleoside 2-deoxyribosyltransferase [Vagococcus intermedius]|uniref:Nucleoside 2-deoxyribosyltransferase n=1 Tax=Vagococcus intermedius TaxID=2991418 RepID=A0AAF0CU59_9ENTE|nr:nucleoside 2-deoxyribosyltransferase [Vagococcus intermedius]WEG73038.1 nucleoside 2-deoxyribosyltransferase [Vagococcus intermedius]WEG75123.1 nucleoside 2-deoxyribosyltransferase [Vagococcus intermedius]